MRRLRKSDKIPKYRNTQAPKQTVTKYPTTKSRKQAKNQIPVVNGSTGDWGIGDTSLAMILREGMNTIGAAKIYDLEERTARFGEAAIRFAKKIPQNPVNNRLISQLVGAATSIGANFCEADDGVSKKDYKNKIGTCRKEARETKHFLRMIATAENRLAEEARELWQEAKELHLIFCAIYKNKMPKYPNNQMFNFNPNARLKAGCLEFPWVFGYLGTWVIINP
jgi:four helix bundle protein